MMSRSGPLSCDLLAFTLSPLQLPATCFLIVARILLSCRVEDRQGGIVIGPVFV